MSKSIRNVAIIAHVDHGKTTLLDALLKQGGTFREKEKVPERVMDSNDQERERGITILSKNTAIEWNGVRVNIVDTPGHADFGGEVERVLRMVDTTLLLVDAAEGPMPQTKFVLRKSLELGHHPIVVINKIDRPDRRIDAVIDEVFDLFVSLDASDEQLDFPVVYACARDGIAKLEPDHPDENLSPLMETILERVPAPPDNATEPLQLQVATLGYDDYLGRIAVGRIYRGTIRKGQKCTLMRLDGTQTNFRVNRLMTFLGLQRVDTTEATSGDIVALAGIENVTVGETICDETTPDAMAPIPIDEPTVSMTFIVNNSPFAGKDGKYVTSRNIRERLDKELEHDVSLRVKPGESPDMFQVSGRGTLHLSVLIESMRREGYELQVSQPQVIVKEVDGEEHEPFEEVFIECEDPYSGTVIEKLNKRGGDLQDLHAGEDGSTRIRYIIPSRGLIGYRSEFLTDTRGTGVMYPLFSHYGPRKGNVRSRGNGVLIVQDNGDTVAYALHSLQDRGILCTGATESVYKGQIIGIHAKFNDLVVNPSKKKQLSNMRSSGADDAIKLTPPKRFTLEEALEFIENDELVEVTPNHIRLRKRELEHSQRRKKSKEG